MSRNLVLWYPQVKLLPGMTEGDLGELGQQALRVGGSAALSHWLNPASPPAPAPARTRLTAAHVHGERHDLWWEFTLEASFRWQAHIHRLRSEVYQQRLHRLTQELGLETLLSREVASLTHSSRALADLAVALLPNPDLLLWEEPFYLLGQTEAARAAQLVRERNQAGMALVAVATQPPGLADLKATEGWPFAHPFHLAQ